jgi:hypothetical protein
MLPPTSASPLVACGPVDRSVPAAGDAARPAALRNAITYGRAARVVRASPAVLARIVRAAPAVDETERRVCLWAALTEYFRAYDQAVPRRGVRAPA